MEGQACTDPGMRTPIGVSGNPTLDLLPKAKTGTMDVSE
jgi:hypothetical protein